MIAQRLPRRTVLLLGLTLLLAAAAFLVRITARGRTTLRARVGAEKSLTWIAP